MRGESVPDGPAGSATRSVPGSTTSHDAGVDRASAARRPLRAGHGDRRFDVAHYDLDLDYRVAATSSSATGHARRGRARATRPVRARPARPARREGAASTGAGRRKYSQRADRLVVAPGERRRGRRPSSTVVVRYAGHPRPMVAGAAATPAGRSSPTACSSRPAGRGADLVPVQRPARRQGDATGSVTHRPATTWSPTACWSAGRGAASSDDLGLRAGRADGDLPGDRADRAVRASAAAERPTGPAAVVAPAGLEAAAFDAAFARQAEMIDVFSPAVRALPVRRLHRRRHRRRPRDPARGAEAVDLRRQPRRRRLGGRSD